MTTLTLVRTNEPIPAEAELASARRLMFDCLRGMTELDDKRWHRFWKMLISKDAGETCEVELKFPRNYKFHKKMFALFTVGFEAWEPDRKRFSYNGRPIEKDFEQFREDVVIASGRYIQTFDLKGRMKMKAKSISFASMDDAEFSDLYESVLTVILNQVCVNYKNREELNSVVEKVMEFAS